MFLEFCKSFNKKFYQISTLSVSGNALEVSTIKQNISSGQRLIKEDLIKLNTIAKIINFCKYNAIENKITNINVTEETDYILKFEEDKKKVYLGDASNLSERLSLLKTILEKEKNKEIEIFMNGDVNKDDVYIRYVEEGEE